MIDQQHLQVQEACRMDTRRGQLAAIAAGLRDFEPWFEDPERDAELRKLLVTYVKEDTGRIPRRIRQFTCSCLIVIAMGMLKAGKSTLVNLLARNRHASPTGYGRDTTLRPALIRMAEQGDAMIGSGRIDVYLPAAGEEDMGLGRLMDYLRGIRREPCASPQSHPLTDELVTRILCREHDKLLPVEPLLVVVTLPYHPECRMLQEGRMLLDMPGLDSALAFVSRLHPEGAAAELPTPAGPEADVPRRGLYDAIISECDLMLFVQSSMAPLNEKASVMLRSILSKRSNTSCYIVQNAMRASYWRTEQVLGREEDEQARHARRVIARLMHKILPSDAAAPDSEGIQMSTVNLGMAYDGMFADEEQLDMGRSLTDGSPISARSLREGSGFAELEHNLCREVLNSGQASRFTHCCDGLGEVLQEAVEAVKRQMQQWEQRRDEARARRLEWQTILDETLRFLESKRSFRLSGQIEVENLPSFEESKARAAEMFPDMARRSWVRISYVNDYLRALRKACLQETKDYLLRVLSLADVKVSSVGGDSAARTLSAIDFCAETINRAFMELRASALYRPMPDIRLEWGLSRSGTRLRIDVDAVGGFGKSARQLDGLDELDPDEPGVAAGAASAPRRSAEEALPEGPVEGYRTQGFLWWKSMKPKSSIVAARVEAYGEACRNLMVAEISSRITGRCRQMIEEGIRQGSAAYRERLEEQVAEAEAELRRCERGLEDRRALLAALNRFMEMKELLPALPE